MAKKSKENTDSSVAPPSIVNTPLMPRPSSTVPPTLAASVRKKTMSATAALPTNKFKTPRKVNPLMSGVKNVVPMPFSVASSCGGVPTVETDRVMAAKNSVATNATAKNMAAKAKNTVAKNTAIKNVEMTKRAKINLPVRPATSGDAESVLIAAAPLPNVNTNGKGFVSNTTLSLSQRVPQIELVGKGRGTKVKLPLKTAPGCKMALPDVKLAPSVGETTIPQVAMMRENGGTTVLQNESQKDISIITPAVAITAITPQEKTSLTSHAHGAPPPTSTRPKFCLPMVKHTPPASIPMTPSSTQAPSLSPPPLTIATLLHTHFIGRLYASLHAHYPNVSPPPVDSSNKIICGIDACIFDSPNLDAAGMAARFWVARFYDVVSGGWEVAAEPGQGRQAGVLAGLRDIASVESVGGGTWKINVRERVGKNQIKERDNSEMMSLFVVGCTGDVIGWDEAATSGGRELREDGRLKTESNGQETWHSLRSDWRDHISSHLSNTLSDTVSDILPLIPLIYPAPNPSFDVTHPHLIHKSLYTDPARLALAVRFVLRNLVMDDCFSGPVPTTVRSLRLDVPATQCFYIESVVMPGEIVRNDRGKLAPEIGYVQTTESGHYVLAETGQVIGWEQEGVRAVWRGILGCEEFGDVAVESVCNSIMKEEFFGKGN
ncbi:hypothetical protein BC937DRAFT_93427 [Endogone sp. FLAS-F59071]|nr:hypothetical protein BC937DRAFT_93427 [Endogone sp. FLAS-F59071]|eukprot:RUS14722.1 hypothetical protein BC937DRAFT_93427 [Endogone sp. FLAS-F59071]